MRGSPSLEGVVGELTPGVSIAYIAERGRLGTLGQAVLGLGLVFGGTLFANLTVLAAIVPLLLTTWPRWAHKAAGTSVASVIIGLGLIAAVFPGGMPTWREQRRRDPSFDARLRAVSPWRGDTLVIGWPEASPIQLRLRYRRRRWPFHLVLPVLLWFVAWIPALVLAIPYAALGTVGHAAVLITASYPRRLFVPSALLLAWYARFCLYLWLVTPAPPLSASFGASPIAADIPDAEPDRTTAPIMPPATA